MASGASAAAVKSSLRALRISTHAPSGTTGLSFSTFAKTHRPSPLALPLCQPRQHQQRRPEPPRWPHGSCSGAGRTTTPAGSRCLSSLPAASLEGPRPACGSASLSEVRAHRFLHRRSNQPFSSSGSSSSEGGSNSGSGKLDVEVTHVDAANPTPTASAAAGDSTDGGEGRGDGQRMMPEEDRRPIGAGSPGDGEGGEENVVRFLDVPGSEQTREEKMTIVFTCTVCETRTAKTFAKLSYEKGVVIARCPGCHNLHLIADRLGWFEEAGDGAGGWDIQKITNRIGESDCHVVNEDNVMELNLVDIVGKTTGQKETSSPGGGEGGSGSPRAQGSAEASK